MYHDDGLFGLKWKDKRVISMLSIIHDDTMISKERRSRQAPGGVETLQKPLIIEDYNQDMGGVDKSDQLVVHYGFRKSSKKWWKRVPLRLTGRHFPEPAGGRPDCKVCSDRVAGKRKQTQWQRCVKLLCVSTHVLNATMLSSITSRLQ